MHSQEVISLNKAPLSIDLKSARAEPEPQQEPIQEDEEPPSAAVPEFFRPAPQEDPKKKQFLILRASEFFNSEHYGAAVVHLKCNLRDLSIAQLEQLISDMDTIINSSAASVFCKEMFYRGMGITESILQSKTQWKAEGMTAALRMNKQMDLILERLRLKYVAGRYVPPELECLTVVFGTLQGIHEYNSTIESRKKMEVEIQKEVAPEITEKYKEL